MTASRDEQWMREALRLARRGEGLTRPNPPVGAIVVRAGKVVGRGYHRRAGGPHAEVYALRQAGSKARGATIFVTLEPCCTWGRTPPCTDAILCAGIRRVVVATTDPNPRHAGRGLTLLRRAGIRVDTGVLAQDARDLLAPFAVSITRKRPRVILKMAVSLDGRIADAHGRSKWITGPAARKAVQDLRRQSDAVLIGATTALRDDPSLLPRPARGRNPYRVIVDTSGRLSPAARVLTDEARHRTIVATTRACPTARQRAYEEQGAQVRLLPSKDEHVSLKALLRGLHRLGVLQVLVEGGGRLAEALLRTGWVDELRWFVAPVVIGNRGIPAMAGKGWTLPRAPRMRIVETCEAGADIMIRAVPARAARSTRTR
jgi:diaminohydroxyphosphoribosylaminopyrimidine deaminase/5-amino-6-(5-phosphoribosylamino)uracil reductase